MWATTTSSDEQKSFLDPRVARREHHPGGREADCNFSRICSAQDSGSADPKSDHFEPKSGQNDPGLGLKYLEIDPKSASGGSQTTLILCHLGRKSFAPNVSHLGSFHGSPSGISAHFSGRPAHFCGARFRLCWP